MHLHIIRSLVTRKFRSIKNFPGVIGAVHCTHTKIKKTGGDLAQYYIDREGFYSLNVQVVCDSHLKIRDVIAICRGSTHDYRIFVCALKQRFEDIAVTYVILGLGHERGMFFRGIKRL